MWQGHHAARRASELGVHERISSDNLLLGFRLVECGSTIPGGFKLDIMI